MGRAEQERTVNPHFVAELKMRKTLPLWSCAAVKRGRDRAEGKDEVGKMVKWEKGEVSATVLRQTQRRPHLELDLLPVGLLDGEIEKGSGGRHDCFRQKGEEMSATCFCGGASEPR